MRVRRSCRSVSQEVSAPLGPIVHRQLSLFDQVQELRELLELEELDLPGWPSDLERRIDGKWRDSNRLLEGEEVIVSPLLCGGGEGEA